MKTEGKSTEDIEMKAQRKVSLILVSCLYHDQRSSCLIEQDKMSVGALLELDYKKESKMKDELTSFDRCVILIDLSNDQII